MALSLPEGVFRPAPTEFFAAMDYGIPFAASRRMAIPATRCEGQTAVTAS